jgi:uncharacterized protein
MSVIETKDGATLTIFVKPNAPKFKIELDSGEIVIYSTEEPIKGKVNKEIIKQAGKQLGFNTEIVSGLTSKQKVLLFRGISKAQLETRLSVLGKK